MPAPVEKPSVVNYFRSGPHAEYMADGSLIITIPTRRNLIKYGISFASQATVDIFMIPLMPLMFCVGMLLYLMLGKPTPRAIIRVTKDEISMQGCGDDTLGRKTTYVSWPRTEVTEFRANRYGRGLYLRIAGKVNLDLLTDIPDEWARQIDAALRSELTRFA